MWKDFHWPAWVPSDIQKEVVDLWQLHTPADWIKSAFLFGAPKFGLSVVMPNEQGVLCEGRYVHLANDFGVVINKKGYYYKVWCHEKFMVNVYPVGYVYPESIDYQKENVDPERMVQESIS